MPQNVHPVQDSAPDVGHLDAANAQVSSPASHLLAHTTALPICQDDTFNYFLLDSADNGLPATEAWQPMSLDSILVSAPTHTCYQRSSLFTGHSLQRVSERAIPHTNQSPSGWGFILFALTVTTVALYSNKHRFRLGDILRSAIDVRTMSRTLRESNINRTSSLIPMTFVYAMAVSLLLLIVADSIHFVLPFNHIALNFVALVAGTSLFLLLREGMTTLSGGTFCNTKSMLIYNENTSVYQFIGGVLTTPIILLAIYSPLMGHFLSRVAIGIIAFLFVLRFLRGCSLLASSIQHNLFFLLFYVCVFEIVPLLVIGIIYL